MTDAIINLASFPGIEYEIFFSGVLYSVVRKLDSEHMTMHPFLSSSLYYDKYILISLFCVAV